MRFVDVNVFVYAHRPESPDHTAYADWLDETRAGPEPVAVSDLALSGFVRVVTHPRIFAEPTPTPVALEFASALRSSPASVRTRPGDRHWAIFEDLCLTNGSRGNDLPDAFLAAEALELGASFWTADRALRRFDGLDVRHPLTD